MLWVCFFLHPRRKLVGNSANKKNIFRPKPIQVQLAPIICKASMFKLEKLQKPSGAKNAAFGSDWKGPPGNLIHQILTAHHLTIRKKRKKKQVISAK